MRLIALLACLLAAAPASGSTPVSGSTPSSSSAARSSGTAAAETARGDPVRQLGSRLARLRSGRVELDEKVLGELAQLVQDVRLLWGLDPARETDAAMALLEVAGAFLHASGGKPGSPGSVRDLALEALRERLDADFARWLAREVAVRTDAPVELRIAAVRLLEDQTLPEVRDALIACAAAHPVGIACRPDELRPEALASLAGWHDPAVHAAFLAELERELAGDACALGHLAERHFAQVSSTDDARLLAGLERLVRAGLLARDWRIASRAVALSRPFPSEVAVPRLVEALALWQARGPEFGHAARLSLEITRELRARSGRDLGLSAEPWRRWWAASRGRNVGANPAPAGAPARDEAASFFGLPIASDRVVFVMDRSHSMQGGFGGADGTGRTRRRWDAAVAQLFAFLAANGPECRFDMVLFHDYAESWRGGVLQRADAAGLAAAREWLASHEPGGGTGLQRGVFAALPLTANGAIDLARLEADTLVVLCDGETDEGPSWVQGFAAGPNASARLVVHGVQIGGNDDGTLEELARQTGGQLVRVPVD